MIPLGSLVRQARQAGQLPQCSNGECSARRWQFWVRRSEGIRINESWYCGEDCARVALTRLVAGVPRVTSAPEGTVHRLPLGLLMLARGVIDESQLRAAMAVQADHPERKIGRCLEDLGAIAGGDITKALGAQHCVPVLVAFEPELDSRVPLPLLEASRCVAFRGSYHAGLVYFGFDTKVDRLLVNAAEEVLGCQCEPCIAESRIVEQHLEKCRQAHNPDEIVFDAHFSTLELVGSIASYMQQLRADAIRIAATRQYLWARLRGIREVDLLFRLH
jgi:hypothetical protein